MQAQIRKKTWVRLRFKMCDGPKTRKLVWLMTAEPSLGVQVAMTAPKCQHGDEAATRFGINEGPKCAFFFFPSIINKMQQRWTATSGWEFISANIELESRQQRSHLEKNAISQRSSSGERRTGSAAVRGTNTQGGTTDHRLQAEVYVWEGGGGLPLGSPACRSAAAFFCCNPGDGDETSIRPQLTVHQEKKKKGGGKRNRMINVPSVWLGSFITHTRTNTGKGGAKVQMWARTEMNGHLYVKPPTRVWAHKSQQAQRRHRRHKVAFCRKKKSVCAQCRCLQGEQRATG